MSVGNVLRSVGGQAKLLQDGAAIARSYVGSRTGGVAASLHPVTVARDHSTWVQIEATRLLGDKGGYASIDDAVRAARAILPEASGDAVLIRRHVGRDIAHGDGAEPFFLHEVGVFAGKSDWSTPLPAADADRVRFKGLVGSRFFGFFDKWANVESSAAMVFPDRVVVNKHAARPR